MKHFTLTETAKKRMYEIAEYTLDNWGKAQCDYYLDLLEEGFNQICRNPKNGPEYHEAAIRLWRRRVEKHIIYYTIKDKEVLIVNILHENMDPSMHL